MANVKMGGNKRRPGLAPGEKLSKGIVKRFLKDIFSFYPILLPITIVCILFSALVSSIPSIFQQKVISIIEESYKAGDWNGVKGQIFSILSILVVLYVISICASFAFTQLMAFITQGTLKQMRCKMFAKMEKLPIKYFDRRAVGDTMSHYTNDVDAIRQMISQSFPNLLNTIVVIVTVIAIMLYFSIWMTIVVMLGVALMFVATKKVGSGSAKYLSLIHI